MNPNLPPCPKRSTNPRPFPFWATQNHAPIVMAPHFSFWKPITIIGCQLYSSRLTGVTCIRQILSQMLRPYQKLNFGTIRQVDSKRVSQCKRGSSTNTVCKAIFIMATMMAMASQRVGTALFVTAFSSVARYTGKLPYPLRSKAADP